MLTQRQVSGGSMSIKQRLIFILLLTTVVLAGCNKAPQNEVVEDNEPPPDSPVIGHEAGTDALLSRKGAVIDPKTHPGRALFEENCLTCHGGDVAKAPAAVWLEMMSPDLLLSAMNDGIMKEQSAHLTSEQRSLIAEYVSRTSLADYKPPEPPAMCADDAMTYTGKPPARVGWGHDTRRFVSADIAGISPEQVPNLSLKWSFAYPSALRARSQPAIGWNTIYVGSQDGRVYAFDLDTGCTRWTWRAPAEVRTAIVVDPDSERLYFADVHARVYAMNAKTGELLWQTKIDDHPNATVTGSPSLGDGQLFVPLSSLEVVTAANPAYACCTFAGSVVALDLESGDIQWKTYTVSEQPKKVGETSIGTAVIAPSGAPVWNSPAWDKARGRIYFGSGENYSSPADTNSDAIFALDTATGEKIWTTQLTPRDAWNMACVPIIRNENCPEEDGPDFDFAASPIIAGDGKTLVIGQKSGDVYGLNIESGEILWNQRLGRGGTSGGVHFGMASDGETVWVPINDMDNTGGDDVSLYGAGLHAVDIASGKVLWRNIVDEDFCGDKAFCDPGISSAITAIPGVVFAGHLDGRFLAYDAETGDVLWSWDTTGNVETVTGTVAHGGSMSGPGPAIFDGHVVLNSGYGLYNHMPGNLLLVFSVSE